MRLLNFQRLLSCRLSEPGVIFFLSLKEPPSWMEYFNLEEAVTQYSVMMF